MGDGVDRKSITTIEEYIDAAPEKSRQNMQELYQILLKIAPKNTATIKWNVPIFWQKRVIFGFSALQNHISFGPGEDAVKAFQEELSTYKHGKGTIQFPYKEKLPVSLIRKIAKFCVGVSPQDISPEGKTSAPNNEVDKCFKQSKPWAAEMLLLRKILLDCGLSESLKWGKPCYSLQKSNVAILQGFKESGALMFFKGALMKDSKNILEKPGENSQAARRFMFRSERDIRDVEATLKAYIKEAISIEDQGLQVEFKQATVADIPHELSETLKSDKAYKNAFEALTPGRQRSYFLHISSAKQEKTRWSRVEKCRAKVLSGKGFNEP
ncbi:hypothetical protein TDB9533_04572 [Thalassocella blandensis]|nr:hypothetical protein TDB9533_04572 [Thalassocella blandensis]